MDEHTSHPLVLSLWPNMPKVSLEWTISQKHQFPGHLLGRFAHGKAGEIDSRLLWNEKGTEPVYSGFHSEAACEGIRAHFAI